MKCNVVLIYEAITELEKCVNKGSPVSAVELKTKLKLKTTSTLEIDKVSNKHVVENMKDCSNVEELDEFIKN